MNAVKISRYISKILSNVSKKGDKAVSFYTAKYDRVKLKPSAFRIPVSRIRSSGSLLPAGLKSAIKKAAENIKIFHAKELTFIKKEWKTNIGGIKTGMKFSPVETAGIYVPGGRFPYPSTVLMAAIPAKAAGVRRVFIVTPPRNASPAVLYAAYCAGVTEIFAVNGPAAIAAMAFGTRTIPKVDMIAGPGNAYVNEAKRQVIGRIGIDSLAGPSEVAIIADSSAKAGFIIADIFAQTEHAPDARAFLFTDSKKLLERVNSALKGRKRQYKGVLCPINSAIDRVNALAPEHLELAVKKPARVAALIKNAGAVFSGAATPTAVGDYWAGPSHVLPTGGAARFSGGLSAATFLKKTSYIECGKKPLKKYGPVIETLASSEGLVDHAKSVAIRYSEEQEK